MPRHVALLRAINVGGRRVTMEALRQVFESLALAGVQTHAASGNVIFESRATARSLVPRIEAALQQALGYEVATFLRSSAELAGIAQHAAFTALPAEAKLYVVFLDEPLAAAATARLMAQRSAIDDFHVHGREVYWRCMKGFADSPLSGPLLEKTMGVRATVRNITAVRKLAALCPPAP
jgi:uncharacterized protein (DUF1697 family)